MRVTNWDYPREHSHAREVYDEIVQQDEHDVLNRAADELERRPWGQGAGGWAWWTSEDAPVCIEGAIFAALQLKTDDDEGNEDTEVLRAFGASPLYHHLLSFIKSTRVPKYPFNAIFTYNDSIATSKQDVIDVLRGAAHEE